MGGAGSDLQQYIPLGFPREQQEESCQSTPLPNTGPFHKFVVCPTTTETKRRTKREGHLVELFLRHQFLAVPLVEVVLVVGILVVIEQHDDHLACPFRPITRPSIQLARKLFLFRATASLCSSPCTFSLAAFSTMSAWSCCLRASGCVLAGGCTLRTLRTLNLL